MANIVLNSFNIGQDASVSLLYQPTGIVIPAATLGHLMEIDADQLARGVKIIPITNGGRPKLVNVYEGWNGRLTWSRMNGVLVGIMASLEQNFYNGIRAQWNIIVTVVNQDGTIDEYTFTNVVLTNPKFGTYRADREVEQPVSFEAEYMVVNSGYGTLVPLAA